MLNALGEQSGAVTFVRRSSKEKLAFYQSLTLQFGARSAAGLWTLRRTDCQTPPRKTSVHKVICPRLSTRA